MKQLKQIFITLILCSVVNLPLSAQNTARAAIDFGSGAVKIQMVEVDAEENRIVGESLLAKYVPLGLTEDVAMHDGFISEAMYQKAINILQGFKEEALEAAARAGHAEIEIRQEPILQTHESGNPVFKTKAIELTQRIKEHLPSIPDWLKEKLNSDEGMIATFGDGESIFALVSQAVAYLEGTKEQVQQATISFSDVQRVIDSFIEQGDEIFMAAGLHCKTLTSAVHLSALMEHLGIQVIHYKRPIGNTPGMLIAPQLWEKGVSSSFSSLQPQ